jgi:hypothetical protein
MIVGAFADPQTIEGTEGADYNPAALLDGGRTRPTPARRYTSRSSVAPSPVVRSASLPGLWDGLGVVAAKELGNELKVSRTRS